MPNKSIFLIGIVRVSKEKYWYKDLINTHHYAVKTRIGGKIWFEVINNPQFKEHFIDVLDVTILELVTRVLLPLV